MELTINEATILVKKAQNLVFCVSCPQHTPTLIEAWKSIPASEKECVFLTLNITTVSDILELKRKSNQIIVFNSLSTSAPINEFLMMEIYELAKKNNVVFLNDPAMSLYWSNRSVYLSVLPENQTFAPSFVGETIPFQHVIETGQ